MGNIKNRVSKLKVAVLGAGINSPQEEIRKISSYLEKFRDGRIREEMTNTEQAEVEYQQHGSFDKFLEQDEFWCRDGLEFSQRTDKILAEDPIQIPGNIQTWRERLHYYAAERDKCDGVPWGLTRLERLHWTIEHSKKLEKERRWDNSKRCYVRISEGNEEERNSSMKGDFDHAQSSDCLDRGELKSKIR